MKAVLIPGDGIGPEISASVESITKAMNLDIEWVKYRAGAEYAKETGEVWEPGLVDAIEEYKWAYPKLCDYQSEWLNYILEHPIGDFPYETVTTNSTATVNNVVPYAYKSAILKGSTKYRDIDTGEILEAFEEGRNLELVSVKMPVLTATGKNLFSGIHTQTTDLYGRYYNGTRRHFTVVDM